MPPRTNQHKPLPPLDVIGPHILECWKMKMTDVQILTELQTKVIDSKIHGIGMTSYRRIREEMGLLRTRQQGHSVETIRPAMERLRKHYPNAGAREMMSLLFHEEGMSVPRSVITHYFAVFEPRLVKERKAGRLRRRKFWAAGSSDILACDQHDKWKCYGLALHMGIDPFIGRGQWLKIWWTNNNPVLILNYYLDFVEESGFMPLVTQSDPGSENYGMAHGHTALRHWHDPSLRGTLQHRWMRDKKNVMPEISWSQLRRRFTPGFENLLAQGVNEGWYDPSDDMHVLVFRWVFIPWLQRELDAYRTRLNNTRKRADKTKVLPHGVPNHMLKYPSEYGFLDFGVKVSPEALQFVREKYIPKNDPVFDLVPPSFGQMATHFYDLIGNPTITRQNVWDVFRDLLNLFEELDNIPYDAEWQDAVALGRKDEHEYFELALPSELADLRGGMERKTADGGFYMGGVNGGDGMDSSHESQIAALTEDDDHAAQLLGDTDEDYDDIIIDRFTSDEESDSDEQGDW